MENVLRLSMQKDPVTLDPQKSGDRFSSAVIFLLFRGLTRLEPDHSVRCDIARSFHSFADHRKYVFYLGEHFWSDGLLITAHDFVSSWKRAISPAFPARAVNIFSHIHNADKAKKGLLALDKVGLYAPDDFTLVVELENPCPYFPEIASFCPLFPVSSKAVEKEISSISSGAFQLQSWRIGKEILLKKNLYCKNHPQLDAIEIKIIPNEKRAFTLFENNQLDWIGDPISPLPVNYLPALISEKKIKPVAGLVSCWFNTAAPPFSNLNLRKAFAHATPRAKLMEKLLLPHSLLATRFCPSIPGRDDPLFYPSPNDAEQLFKGALQELRVKKLKVALHFEATDECSRLAALLKVFWEQMAGLSISLEPMSFKEFWQKLPQHQFPMSLCSSISQYSDLINFLERLEFKNSPRNFSAWQNFHYQRLLQRYRKTEDQKMRQTLAEKAEAILAEEMPVLPLYYHHFAYIQKPHVKNLAVSPIGVMQFDRVRLENRSLIPRQELGGSLHSVLSSCFHELPEDQRPLTARLQGFGP